MTNITELINAVQTLCQKPVEPLKLLNLFSTANQKTWNKNVAIQYGFFAFFGKNIWN